MLHHLPNAVTLLNLFCGACASLCIIYGRLEWAIGLVALGALFDLLDGMVARWLNVHSELGKQLDSLADMVSFGLVPGLIVYGLIAAAWQGHWPKDLELRALPAFLLTLFAALRLGKFNLDERQTEGFLGLPTPGCTLFMIGLLGLYLSPAPGLAFLFHAGVLYGITLLFSALMVVEIPMFSFKFKTLQWTGNEIRIIFAAISVALVVSWQVAGLSAVVLLYIISSCFIHFFKRKPLP
ncbi:MAG TPA: CDP-alcohol phosphatidyltransferase family protein [Haliscomenobacter sp.]|uniref:CDP-alcohol phosphatidyltransferase family protein n=1 Tax=Haliscomenobacter sp. TaxID=2717303 RepID=UPI002C98565A|nr:CDP-alcohol phosphatidyltransferase family protein [Haliscomenobacter sp.]HOY16763.1 CDP-alcohol phosphatidyltransferase family protein [Haliscomenobacter sp.]